MRAPTERTALYRFYDADGASLYVGISCHPDKRWNEHRYGSGKWPLLVITRVDQWFDTRWEAEAAEIAAIKTEKPRFNGSHNFTEVPIDSVDWPRHRGTQVELANLLTCVMRGEISTGRWEAGQRLPRTDRLASVAGVGRKAVSVAMAKLKQEGWVDFWSGKGYYVLPLPPRRVVATSMYEAIHGPAREHPSPPTAAPVTPKTFVKMPHDWCWSQHG